VPGSEHEAKDSSADEVRAAVAAERQRADSHQRLTDQQGHELDSLRRRGWLRTMISFGRRSRPFVLAVGRRAAGGRRLLAWLELRLRAIGRVSRRARSGIDLIDAVGRLPEPPPLVRTVSVIVTSGPVADLDQFEREGAVETLVLEGDRRGTRPNVFGRRAEPHSGESLGAMLARAVERSSGELVCIIASTTRPLAPGWLAHLAAQLHGDIKATAPLLVHPRRRPLRATPHDERVREMGLDLYDTGDGFAAVRSRQPGDDPDPSSSPVDVVAASAACLLVDRRASDAAGGLASIDDLDAAAVELCWRLKVRGGRVVVVPSCTMVDERSVTSTRELETPLQPMSDGWRAVIERHGPSLRRTAAGKDAATQPSFVITAGMGSRRAGKQWGDWYLAEAMASAIRRLGHDVRVQTSADADHPASRSCDVHLVLRGLTSVARTPGQRHVLWVISHPELLDVAECDAADLVLVASERFARELQRRTDTPVEVMLQATDPRRFRPLPPVPQHSHSVAIVANARHVRRRVVTDALEAGLRPAIYGRGWQGLVDRELVVAEHVPNERLAAVYSSIGVLLNDHWDSMRSWGFVSNRLFDALACGTPIISDDLPEIHDLFGDAVATYHGPDDLRALVETTLGDLATARERASKGREAVLEAHTFDHRALQLLDAISRDAPPQA
jgi:hypothetical protein